MSTSIKSQISQLSAQPTSSAQQAQLKNLQTELTQATDQAAVDQQTLEATKASTATPSAVTGSVVLDSAVPLAHSRLKYLLIYALTGLAFGLALGLGIVIVHAIVSGRLRRRDDVTHALGAPVKLSVGPVKLEPVAAGPARAGRGQRCQRPADRCAPARRRACKGRRHGRSSGRSRR